MRSLITPRMSTVWFVAALVSFVLLVTSAGSLPVVSAPFVWAVALVVSLALYIASTRSRDDR